MVIPRNMGDYKTIIALQCELCRNTIAPNEATVYTDVTYDPILHTFRAIPNTKYFLCRNCVNVLITAVAGSTIE